MDDVFFFKRGPIQEVCIFVSRLVVQQCTRGALKSVRHQEYLCHVRIAQNGLSVAAVCDAEFPATTAFKMLKNAMDHFNKEIPELRWKDLTQDVDIGVPGMMHAIEKLEKTEQIQKELDEVKEIMQDTIDKLFDRDLEALMQQSEDLSSSTKMMVKQSKELNSQCPDCIIL